MDRLDVEIEYRMTKWYFTNLFLLGEISLEEYTKIHERLIKELNPPMKSVETPGYYIQEVSEIE